MYVPEHFRETDPRTIAEFVERHDFGILFSAAGGEPCGTHLPFTVRRDANDGIAALIAHMARANPHWRQFDGKAEALIVFQGPHAYISPSWYPAEEAVPTWNYATVHVYGRPRLIEEDAAVDRELKALVDIHEGGAWSVDTPPAGYIRKMRKGLVAFEIPVEHVEAKFKLNQNHPEANRRGAIAGLRDRARGDDLAIAALMEETLGKA